MIYLESFTLPSDRKEDAKFDKFDCSHMRDLQNFYPWKFFIYRKPQDDTFRFSDITIFYGGNGSGKSTLLNLIGQKLGLHRVAPFNSAPCFNDFLEACDYELSFTMGAPHANVSSPIRSGSVIASDDVFRDILRKREEEQRYEIERAELWKKINQVKSDGSAALPKRLDFSDKKSMEDYRERYQMFRSSSVSYARRRINQVVTKSNGENAFDYFVNAIRPQSLTLLDEPENSLSTKWQRELAAFLHGCVLAEQTQLIISTHSPFVLAIPGAKIYNLDESPITSSPWHELENVRYLHELFEENRSLFS